MNINQHIPRHTLHMLQQSAQLCTPGCVWTWQCMATTDALATRTPFSLAPCTRCHTLTVWPALLLQAVDFVRARLKRGLAPRKICEELCDACLAPNTNGCGRGELQLGLYDFVFLVPPVSSCCCAAHIATHFKVQQMVYTCGRPCTGAGYRCSCGFSSPQWLEWLEFAVPGDARGCGVPCLRHRAVAFTQLLWVPVGCDNMSAMVVLLKHTAPDLAGLQQAPPPAPDVAASPAGAAADAAA